MEILFDKFCSYIIGNSMSGCHGKQAFDNTIESTHCTSQELFWLMDYGHTYSLRF